MTLTENNPDGIADDRKDKAIELLRATKSEAFHEAADFIEWQALAIASLAEVNAAANRLVSRLRSELTDKPEEKQP